MARVGAILDQRPDPVVHLDTNHLAGAVVGTILYNPISCNNKQTIESVRAGSSKLIMQHDGNKNARGYTNAYSRVHKSRTVQCVQVVSFATSGEPFYLSTRRITVGDTEMNKTP